EFQKDVSNQSKHRHDQYIEAVVIQAVCPNCTKQQDGRIENVVAHTQNANPDANQWKINDYQKQITNPHAGNQAPEQLWLLGENKRTRLNTLNDQRTGKQRHYRVARQAKGQ